MRLRRFAMGFLAPAVLAACAKSVTAPGTPSDTTRIDTLTTAPSAYITVRRAWRPGERDAAIAAIAATRALGQFSPMAALILPRDSTTDVVRNPLAPAAPTAFPHLVESPTSPGMSLVGIDLYQADGTSPSPSPTDTLMWLMAFWYNTTEPGYHGYLTAFSRNATVGWTWVSTTTFDGSGGRSGAGGGESRLSTGEYWEGSSGFFTVTANSTRAGAPTTIPSGPYAGGTVRSGTMGGRMLWVTLTKLLPAPGTNQRVSLDFRGGIGGARITCNWTGTPPACH